jgi:hypothetical protein
MEQNYIAQNASIRIGLKVFHSFLLGGVAENFVEAITEVIFNMNTINQFLLIFNLNCLLRFIHRVNQFQVLTAMGEYFVVF